jgi:signal transduction histidine kinase
MAQTKILKPRPYARLLTMIGDQLIKNEKIALLELIKNSYDADANWVQIRFNNFTVDKDDKDKLILTKDSFIEIEDDGSGMDLSIIEEAWLNPATPNKFLEKQKGKNKTKFKKRTIQGEKGIGRFAVYKLGATIEIITKSIIKDKHELKVVNDLSGFDEEIISKNKNKKPTFLDQIEFSCEIRDNIEYFKQNHIKFLGKKIKRLPHGTLIRISNLKGEWSFSKIDDINKEIYKLKTPFGDKKDPSKFDFEITVNNKNYSKPDDFKDLFNEIIEKAPLKITNGKYDSKKKIFSFNQNGSKRILKLESFSQNKEIKKRFLDSGGKVKRFPECGNFDFTFYIFDFRHNAPNKYKLTTEKKFVKENRIYLFRDDIRVQPYGNPDDDWLGIDVQRGTAKAGDYLSNDQTMGHISISVASNPKLKDKTNREGLIEIGNTFQDFVILIRGFLGYLHQELKKYQIIQDRQKKLDIIDKNIVANQLDLFKEYLEKNKDKEGIKYANELIKVYQSEKSYLIERAEITEDLAAVGITVEAASHDLMLMISRAKDKIDFLFKHGASPNFDKIELKDSLEQLRGQITIIEDQIRGIQPIFRSSKRISKQHRIKDIIESVRKYYDSNLSKNNIEFTIKEIGPPLIAKCPEAFLLQTFINLLDNSFYWLTTVDCKPKTILAKLDGNKLVATFSDNGPGIRKDDIEYVFEPFFSTKGIDGRGLGLYIAKQLLERADFKIDYVSNPNEKLLEGANFKIDFSTE